MPVAGGSARTGKGHDSKRWQERLKGSTSVLRWEALPQDDVSIYDGNLPHCSKFGRVMVMFDTFNNMWRCHGVEAKQACVYKAIAKWHFFQTKKELFMGNECEGT